MVSLRYYGHTLLTKHLLAPHDRVKSSETRIVQDNVRLGNASLHKGLLHTRWLIVIFTVVVTANQNLRNLTRLVQPLASIDSILEIVIHIPRWRQGIRSQHQSNSIVGNLRHIAILPWVTAIHNNKICCSNNRNSDNYQYADY